MTDIDTVSIFGICRYRNLQPWQNVPKLRATIDTFVRKDSYEREMIAKKVISSIVEFRQLEQFCQKKKENKKKNSMVILLLFFINHYNQPQGVS